MACGGFSYFADYFVLDGTLCVQHLFMYTQIAREELLGL